MSVTNLDLPLSIPGSTKEFIHEVLYHIGGKPCSTQTDGNFAGRQILWLYLFQRFHIRLILWVLFHKFLGKLQFLTDIAGQILVCRQILGTAKAGCRI